LLNFSRGFAIKISNLSSGISSSIFNKLGTALAAAAVVMALLLTASAVQATNVEVEGGNAIRITDLPIVVSDVIIVYDVKFRYIRGGGLYGTDSPSTFRSAIVKRTLL
jgi:hypothetical protein